MGTARLTANLQQYLLGQNPELVSPSFYRQLEARSKVRLSFYRDFATKLKEYNDDRMA